MTFTEYLSSLSMAEQDAYAERCGTTGKYLRTHIRPGTRTPRKDLMHALAEESGGEVSIEAVLIHFGLISPSALPEDPAHVASA